MSYDGPTWTTVVPGAPFDPVNEGILSLAVEYGGPPLTNAVLLAAP